MLRSVWADVVFVPFIVVTYSTCHGFAVVVSRSFERGGRLRSKSAVYLVAVLLLFAAFIVSVIIGEFAFGLPEPLDEPQTIRQAVASGLLLLACAGLVGSLLAVAASVLPARSRTGPSTRVNLVLASALRASARLLVVAGFLTPGWVWLIGVDNQWRADAEAADGFEPAVAAYWVSAVLQIVIIWVIVMFGALLASAWLRRTADQLAAPSQAPAGAGHVLYLRPFDEERRIFAANRTFEGFFADPVNEHLGQLVALGDPMDRIAPVGAIRAYHRDDDWQEALVVQARTANCVLAVTSSSPATSWELQRIRELGLQTKLFLLSPPPAPEATNRDSPSWRAPRRTARWLATLIKAYINEDTDRLTHMLSFNRLPDTWSPAAVTPWPDFTSVLTECGYCIDPEQPAPGAVLAFDDTATAVVLATNASTADDYLTPILQTLRARK
jgi:hypothetical protein